MECFLKSWKNKTKDLKNVPAKRMKNAMKVEDDKKEAYNESGADSLPIHCIIQTISTVGDLQACCQKCCGAADATGGDLPWECECKNNETSGCVVVPDDTRMSDLVRMALVKLGYPTFTSSFATGSILIRNWKPLPLEAICPEMKRTVADILGELTAVVSLRIQIFWPKLTILQKMKDNLLLFLIKANQSFLRDSGCPFDMCSLAKFCDQSDYMRAYLLQEPSEDLQQKFQAWLQHLQETEEEEHGKSQPQGTSLPGVVNNPNGDDTDTRDSRNLSPGPKRLEPTTRENGKCTKTPPREENSSSAKESPSFSVMERPKHFPVPKTRVRTSFDPEFELPKLHKWYLDNPHPSRQQIYEYVAELNTLDSRKGRKQLDINNVVYWFKNARAAQKRTECRRFSDVSTAETNRCNVLKIPQGKNCGVTSDDQKSISDDEGSVTSESGDDYRNENGRCLQVVGKWNSNGQGEAVLQMQIAAHKNEFVQSIVQTKKEKLSENEENSRSTDGDSSDFIRRNSLSEKKDFQSGTAERSSTQKENQAINIIDNNKSEIKNSEGSEGKQKQINKDIKKEDVPSSKLQARNTFPSYKENNGVNGNEFLSPYKSGFPVPPNSLLGHSFICMSPYMNPKPNNLPLSSEERRKRNRTFIDPVTEVPRLEQWFRLSTHPSHSLISRYTEELNNMPYRRKFPKLEAKNVQFWFKNRRAKNKRLNYLEGANN